MNKDYIIDKSSFSQELKLIILLIGNYTEEETIAALITDNIDWNEFLRLVYHHRVYSLIYTKFTNTKISIPDYVLSSLYSNYSNNTYKMLGLTYEMDKITKAFTNSEIPVLMLKGPLLSEKLYGSLSLRTSKDLDMLIPIEAIDKAEEVLINLGYVITSDVPRVLNDWKRKAHHVGYINPQNQVMVELHWRLHPDAGSESGFRELWNRKSSSNLTTTPTFQLGDTDMFAYLISHGARHGWFRLRWLVDIDRLLKKHSFSSEHLISTLNKLGLQLVTGQTLLLTEQLLNSYIPNEFNPFRNSPHAYKLANKTIIFIENKYQLSPKPEPNVKKYYQRYLFNLKTSKQKVIYILTRFYPNSWDVIEFPLPKTMYFLYFPLRPVFLVWRYFKRFQSS